MEISGCVILIINMQLGLLLPEILQNNNYWVLFLNRYPGISIKTFLGYILTPSVRISAAKPSDCGHGIPEMAMFYKSRV